MKACVWHALALGNAHTLWVALLIVQTLSSRVALKASRCGLSDGVMCVAIR